MIFKTLTIKLMIKNILFITLLSITPTIAPAQDSSGHQATSQAPRVYDEEHPLVYEDAWDLWPYAFLNDTGEPVGFNIDLLKLIFKELDIPYTIRLRPTQDALNDLKSGRADLMCAMDAHFHNEYAQYGKSVIQIFTHSVVHKKNEPVLIKTVDDLARQHVIVHTGSFSHHLMMQKGWGKNAIPYNDMQEAVQYVHNHKGSQIVWNTLSLKWLLYKFGYNDELELTPVNIPHGEYKFMSNDERLLEQMDSVYARLNSTGRLQPIQNKWFYPERRETGIPSWVWNFVIALLVVIITFIIYYISSRFYERKMTKNVRRSNDRLSLILNTSKVHIWLFDTGQRMLTSINPDGKRFTIPLSPNFVQYYLHPEDYERLCSLLEEMTARKKERETMEMRAIRRNNKEERIFSVDFSVLRRDTNGRPKVIIGATTDITEARQRQQQQKDTMLRYQYIFNTALVDTVLYDENGIIEGMNEKAVKGIGGGLQRIVDAHISVQDVLGAPDLSLDDLDYTYLTQIYKSPDDPRPLNRLLRRDKMYYELQLVPIRDDDNRLLGIYGSGRDVTELAESYSRLQKNIIKLQEATEELQDNARNFDYVMKNGGVRVCVYSPATHTLTVYIELRRVQQRLTQTRLLSLTEEGSKKAAQRILNSMDNLTRQPVKTVVKSTLRRGGKPLCLSFSFVPTTDDNGNIVDYFGMCRDISDIKATEELLALETKRAQEVETVKNAFLRNMCYEIRTPLNSVVGFAELIEKTPNPDDEKFFIEEIKKNSRSLLNLVNNILFLSRLDAGMIEFKPTPVDFAAIFEGRCQSAWLHSQKPGVKYSVDVPYERLVLDIDLTNLGIVIDHIVTNAIQNTTSGYVRASFEYNGEDLTVAIQDTGCGIPNDQLERIFERFVSTDANSSGLGLSICQEVVKLMGGRIRLNSEVGKGTIVWIIIPCTAGEMVRK